MHIYTDDQGTFWLVFAFYFTSCYNSRMYYRNLECRNKTVFECSIVTKISKLSDSEGIRKTISFTQNY